MSGKLENRCMENFDMIKKFYNKQNVKYDPKYFGTRTEMKVKEKEMLTEYYLQHGHLPPGNRIFR